MFGFDQYFFVEWISAWLILNWGAHLALGQIDGESSPSGSLESQWPKLRDQFTYLLHSLIIAWLVQWSWSLLPPLG